LSKREHRSPRRIGRDLREKLKEEEPHSRGSRILSRGGRKMISREDMLTEPHFLVPEVEAEVEEELSHVSRVVKMDTKPLTVQTGSWTGVRLTSLRRSRSVMLRVNMLTEEGRWGCTKFFWHPRKK
jgi:hypothetical protein